MTGYQHPTAGTCPVTGKIKYINRKEAKRVIRTRAYRDVSVYACPDCNHIHIGGWHGVKDRALHREKHACEPCGTNTDEPHITVEDAAAELGVSTEAIHRVIAAGAARGTETHIHHGDLTRLRECTWRTP